MALQNQVLKDGASTPITPPAWMSDKGGKDQVKNVSPAQNIAKKKKKDEVAPRNAPVWMDVLESAGNAIQAAGPVLAGPANIPSYMSNLNPYLADLLLNNMQGGRTDQVAPAGVLRGRTDQFANRMLSARSDQVAPRPFTTNQDGGFVPYYGGYGGNWGYGRGGGGYGGGGYPSWMNNYLKLNNWNI